MSGLKNKNTRSFKSKSKAVTASAVALGAVVFTTSPHSNAIGFSDAVGFIGNLLGISSEQGETIAFRWYVNGTQGALEPYLTSKAMKEIQKTNATIIVADNQANRIKDAIQDLTVGKGIPVTLGCEASAEKSQEQSQLVMGKEQALSDTLVISSDYTKGSVNKLAQRTKAHLMHYCDISEAKAGVCIPRPNGMSGKDSDYANIHSNNILSEDEQEAAFAFVQQTIDPATHHIDGCNTLMCTSISSTDKAYKSLASMSQGAFVAQINDAILHKYEGVGTDLNKKVDAEGLDYLPDASSGGTYNPTPSQPAAVVAKNVSCSADALKYNIKYHRYEDTASVDLVAVKDGHKLHKDAAAAYKKMREAAEKEGVELQLNSGYQSKEYLKGLIESRQAKGESLEDIYKSVPPVGYSKYSTGYALDFGSDADFKQSKAYEWLSKNASKFGFEPSQTDVAPKDKGKDSNWQFNGSKEAKEALATGDCKVEEPVNKDVDASNSDKA